MKYLVSLFLSIAAFAGYACSCANPGEMDDKQYDSYDFIATGVIDAVEAGEEFKSIYFDVNHFYKGKADHSGIILNTALSSAACGLSPNSGEEWLIYANRQDGELHVSLCSRSIVLKAEGMSGVPDRAKEDLMYLDNKEQQEELDDIISKYQSHSQVFDSTGGSPKKESNNAGKK